MSIQGHTSEWVYDGYLRVNSCGRKWIENDYETTEINDRSDYSICYVSSGVIYSETEGIATAVPEGSLVLFPPHVMQRYRFEANVCTILMWSNFSGTATELLSNIVAPNPVIIPVRDRQQFESTFDKMISAYCKKVPYAETICAGYMAVLLCLIMQCSLPNSAPLLLSHSDRLEFVISLMHTEYSQPINIRKYANICCIGENHFIRLFKAYTGLPPYRYQLKIRVEKAKQLLEHTSVSITECAETVGFSDLAHFSRIFKSFTGYPPSYYKKR